MAQRWTDDDVRYLTEHYNEEAVRTIASALGRSEKAVWRKAQEMGLKRPEREPTEYEALPLDTQPENWPYSLERGLHLVTKKVLPRIQRRLGTLVEYGDVYNAAYLWMCSAPYYNMASLEGRLLRIFSDRGMNDGETYVPSATRQDLGAAWSPDAGSGKDVNHG